MNLSRYLLFMLFVSIVLKIHAQPQVDSKFKKYFYKYSNDERSELQKMVDKAIQPDYVVGRSFALIAGVSKYPNMPISACNNQGGDLPSAHIDVNKLKLYLKEYEKFDEIVVLENEAVTIDNFEFFLQTYFAERIGKYPKSRFLFAYSGHGITQNGNGYILKSVASSCSDKKQSIPLNILKTYIQEVTTVAHHSLVLINSCYSGEFVSYGGENGDLIPKYRGAHTITAGTEGELVYARNPREGSLFYEKLFAALDGRANLNKESAIVTANEVYNYLLNQIRKETYQKQNPKKADLERDGSKGEFYFLNRSHFEKKLKPFSETTWPNWIPFGEADQSTTEVVVQPKVVEEVKAPAARLVTILYSGARGEKIRKLTSQLDNKKISYKLIPVDNVSIEKLVYPVGQIRDAETLYSSVIELGNFEFRESGDPSEKNFLFYINEKANPTTEDPVTNHNLARERIISGKVVFNDDMLAAPGVNVVLKGTTNGTVTDSEGTFSITIPNDDKSTLVLSFIGYKTVELLVGDQSIINVTMVVDLGLGGKTSSHNEKWYLKIGIQSGVNNSPIGGSISVPIEEILGRNPISSLSFDLRGPDDVVYNWGVNTRYRLAILHRDVGIRIERPSLNGFSYSLESNTYNYQSVNVGTGLNVWFWRLCIDELNAGITTLKIADDNVTSKQQDFAFGYRGSLNMGKISFYFSQNISSINLIKAGTIFSIGKFDFKLSYETLRPMKADNRIEYNEFIAGVAFNIFIL